MKKEFKELLVTVHMGGSGRFTQNSMAAIHDCWMQSVWAELDIRVTIDSELVVIHDSSTKGLCKGAPDLEIKEHTLEKLQKLELCTGDGIQYPIPCVDTILKQMQTCKDRQILVDVKDKDAFSILKAKSKQYCVEQQVHFFAETPEQCRVLKTAFPKSKILLVIRNIRKISPEIFSEKTIYGFLYCAVKGSIDKTSKMLKNLV